MIRRHAFMVIAACCLNISFMKNTVQGQSNLIANGDFEDGLNGSNASGSLFIGDVVCKTAK